MTREGWQPPSTEPPTAIRTPAGFDGWAIITNTSVDSLPVGMSVYLTNMNGRLVVQSRPTPGGVQLGRVDSVSPWLMIPG